MHNSVERRLRAPSEILASPIISESVNAKRKAGEQQGSLQQAMQAVQRRCTDSCSNAVGRAGHLGSRNNAYSRALGISHRGACARRAGAALGHCQNALAIGKLWHSSPAAGTALLRTTPLALGSFTSGPLRARQVPLACPAEPRLWYTPAALRACAPGPCCAPTGPLAPGLRACRSSGRRGSTLK